MRLRGELVEAVLDPAARLSLAPPLIAGLGLAVCTALAWSLRRAEAAQAVASFELEAQRHVADAHEELSLLLEQVEVTAAFFDGSQAVEPDEFRRFTASRLRRNPPLRALLWIEPTEAAPARSYLVRYADGAEAASFAPGSQLNAPELVTTLGGGAAAEELAFSTSFRPAPGTGPRVLAAVPVLGMGGELRGLVGGVLDLDAIVRAVGGVQELTLSIENLDPSQPLPPVPTGAPGELVELQDRAVGGRVLRLACSAPPGFVASRTTWLPWGVFALGLAATALLAATVASLTSRARILRLVERRSEDVLAAYDTLAQEAQERLQAVAEARRLQRQLREIIDLVPSMIYVRDASGRFLLANEATAHLYGTSVAQLTGPGGARAHRAAGEPEATLREERELIENGLSAVVQAVPFVDPAGRRRILRAVKIPCDVFGKDRRALLCVATDITEQKHTEDILRTQYRILSEIAAGAGLDRVLAQLVGAAEEVVPGMRCSVLLAAPDGRHLLHKTAPSLPAEYNRAVDGLEIGPTVGSCGAAAYTRQRIVIEDVMVHPNWAGARELARNARIRASWSQPILASDGELLGTFAMYYSEPRAPEPFEEEFLESAAHLAGIAIERERRNATAR